MRNKLNLKRRKTFLFTILDFGFTICFVIGVRYRESFRVRIIKEKIRTL